eukprot:TRINITY_DN27647_c0_g1_i1.p1 TRINITY_DN27647_c0_g1~~TRINITY_DN27647_c0_g1_i1.p1  ORF type:complete len:462 (+),score=61.19 TRINITY_DN27647_c0_g1_i1:68-1453(+)
MPTTRQAAGAFCAAAAAAVAAGRWAGASLAAHSEDGAGRRKGGLAVGHHPAGLHLPAAELVLFSYATHSPARPSEAQPYAAANFVYTALVAAAMGYEFRLYLAPEAQPAGPPPGELCGGGQSSSCLPADCAAPPARSCSGYSCRSCVGPRGCLLHPAWCKVKAAMQAAADFPSAPFFLWLDTDAAPAFEHRGRPLALWLRRMAARVGSDPVSAPFMPNQEQPTWWCNRVKVRNGTGGVHYSHCYNTGVFAFWQGAASVRFMRAWWQSALGDYRDDPLGFPYRPQWPWEQDRLMAVAHEGRFGVRHLVRAIPDPDRFEQRNWMHAEKDPGRCLAAVPRWRCVVSHYCGDPAMKMFWGHRTAAVAAAQLAACHSGRPEVLEMPALPAAGAHHDALPPAYPMRLTLSPVDCPRGVAGAVAAAEAASGWAHSAVDVADSEAAAARWRVVRRAAELLAAGRVSELR